MSALECPHGRESQELCPQCADCREPGCTCVYGPEFLDDGVPHRIITFMCKQCEEKSRKALDFLVSHKVLQTPPAGSA